MYNKGRLATRWDAGQAFLHRGESNGGAYLVCIVHSMQEVGPATNERSSPNGLDMKSDMQVAGHGIRDALSAESKNSYTQASHTFASGHTRSVVPWGSFTSGSP